jgi:hypothetical protein
MSFTVYHKNGAPAGRVTPLNHVHVDPRTRKISTRTKYVYRPIKV